jgi:hypothetical protein
MSCLVFLLEEYSMKVFLDGLLPRLFAGLRFRCVPHEGKQDLEKSIPRKLRAWREPGVYFCVIRDNDGGDCQALKGRLLALCREAKRDDVLVRIACQELEAWYFGELDALAGVFQRDDLRVLSTRARFRDPDGIDQPARALAELVDEFQKVSGARRMAARLSRNNRSRSYQVLIEGIERLEATVLTVATSGGGVGTRP